jgi:hypothetical protein
MAEPRRWFCGLALGIAVPVALLYAAMLPLHADPDEKSWVATSLAHKIAHAEGSPKILITGGSNALFGLSAQYIEQRTGIRTVNLAVHAGLGRRYILHVAQPLLGKGDVVVVVLEYPLYGPEKPDPMKTSQVLVHDRGYFWSLPVAAQLRFLMDVPASEWLALWRAQLTGQPTYHTIYDAATQNAWGDETGNGPERANRAVIESLERRPPATFSLAPEAVDDLAAFAKRARERGARVAVAFPSMLAAGFDAARNRAFTQALREDLSRSGIVVLGTPEGALFSDDLAFDTLYHQNARGQRIASERLLEDLRRERLVPPGP